MNTWTITVHDPGSPSQCDICGDQRRVRVALQGIVCGLLSCPACVDGHPLRSLLDDAADYLARPPEVSGRDDTLARLVGLTTGVRITPEQAGEWLQRDGEAR